MTKDYAKFKNLGELGKELVELHLLRHPSLSETEIGFPVSGSNTVEKVRYDEENRRVYFNKEQYFDGISKVVWEYQISWYQVLAKYLKNRKKRELSLEEMGHYISTQIRSGSATNFFLKDEVKMPVFNKEIMRARITPSFGSNPLYFGVCNKKKIINTFLTASPKNSISSTVT